MLLEQPRGRMFESHMVIVACVFIMTGMVENNVADYEEVMTCV